MQRERELVQLQQELEEAKAGLVELPAVQASVAELQHMLEQSRRQVERRVRSRGT